MLQRLRYRLAKFFFGYLINSYLSPKDHIKISPLAKGANNLICEGKNLIPEFCNFSGKVFLGYKTTLGLHNFFHGNIKMGKYCQVGAYVAIHTTNHPMNHLTTYINKNLFDGELANLKKEGTIEIGHDVWIGHNAILVGSFRVGNGAIIAAGAVVTSDVPAYSIVGGIPAKVIRYRFSQNIIAEIEALAWWNKSEEELKLIKPLFLRDLSQQESLYS
jgi:virginiamycin A acetyltransferase